MGFRPDVRWGQAEVAPRATWHGDEMRKYALLFPHWGPRTEVSLRQLSGGWFSFAVALGLKSSLTLSGFCSTSSDRNSPLRPVACCGGRERAAAVCRQQKNEPMPGGSKPRDPSRKKANI